MNGLTWILASVWTPVLALANVQNVPSPDIPAAKTAVTQTTPETTLPVETIKETAIPLAYAGKSDEEVFELATAYIQDLKTLTADFTQTAPDGTISNGKVDLARPSRLNFDYAPPSPQRIIASQGLVYVEDRDLETVDSYPVNKTPLKFLLNRTVKADDMVLSNVERTSNSVAITLDSTDEEMEGTIVMVFEAPKLLLRRWAVIDGRGGVTVVDLDNVITGKKINAVNFRIPDAGGKFLRDN